MLASPKSAHLFKSGSTFKNGFKLYCFDRELRKMILGELEKIEVAVRSVMIYNLSHHHGPFWYSDSSIFLSTRKFNDTLNKIRDEFNRTDEEFIKAFKAEYSDPLPPSWMMLELATFGSLSMLYSNLKDTHDRRNVAHYFGLDDTTLASWLHCIAYVRNICAHHSRLWSRVMRISPNIPLTPLNPWIFTTTVPALTAGDPPVKINNRTYYLLSMIVYLLETVNPNNSFKTRLYKLFRKYKMVDVRAMGFPTGWEDEPLWEWEKIIRQDRLYFKILNYFKTTLK